MNSKKILIIAFVLITSHYALVTPSQAQQAHFSLNPPIVQTKIKPGKAIIVAYSIENKGDPTNLQFIVRPFTPVGQLGSLTLASQLEGPVQFNLENADVTLEKPFFFPSKEKRQAVLRIYIPPGIPDGDYYYMVLAETVPAFSVGGQSTGIISASIGSPLLISITESGITEVKAAIADFSFKPTHTFTIGNSIVRIVDSTKDLPLICSVQNMGRNLIQPQGTIVDQYGKKKNKYNIVPQNILSKSQRIITSVSNASTSKTGSTIILSHPTIGSHRVTAGISFDDSGTIQYKTLTFVALPLQLIYITTAILVVVSVFFIMMYLRRRYR